MSVDLFTDAGTYSQDTVLEGPNLPFARVRASSDPEPILGDRSAET